MGVTLMEICWLKASLLIITHSTVLKMLKLRSPLLRRARAVETGEQTVNQPTADVCLLCYEGKSGSVTAPVLACLQCTLSVFTCHGSCDVDAKVSDAENDRKNKIKIVVVSCIN